MSLEIVARPNAKGNRKYHEYYAALTTTVATATAIKVPVGVLSRAEVNSICQHFQARNPTLRVHSRKLPDGIYLWADKREPKPDQDPEKTLV